MNAIERIGKLANEVVDRKLEVAEQSSTPEERTAADFLMKVTGMKQEDIRSSILKDPMTWVTAIMAYLEEKDREQK